MNTQKGRKYIVNDPATARHVSELINQLNTVDQPWEVVIKRFKKQRTLSQNGLYWGWLEIIGAEIGYDPDELHDVLREKFLPVEFVIVLGVERKRLTSTSDPQFNTAMMAEYLNQIERFAITDLDITLPRPADKFHEEMANLERC